MLVLNAYFSNVAYALLGRCVLENVLPGTTYEDYVTSNILSPLGMNSTGFDITERYMYMYCSWGV